MPAKTPAQRQAERAAREKRAGRSLWKRWVTPDEAKQLSELAEKLAAKRAKEQK